VVDIVLLPQFLVKQLTLSQPADYAHHSVTSPSWIFKPCDGPECIFRFREIFVFGDSELVKSCRENFTGSR
jgi:hypothetical protein